MSKEFVKKPIKVRAYKTDKVLYIETLEGTMKADIGDWIVTGIEGERYPVKPDIFFKTYEAVED
ncbi:hypothetical protein MKZ17_07690 [Solibacillus sp. FSL R7-0682]|uniref:hypothetical protein n=1 Tax=Solibacillus sp. FSL R7-0682 TaxID=2921690 RepID=UPI0030FAA8DC